MLCEVNNMCNKPRSIFAWIRINLILLQNVTTGPSAQQPVFLCSRDT